MQGASTIEPGRGRGRPRGVLLWARIVGAAGTLACGYDNPAYDAATGDATTTTTSAGASTTDAVATTSTSPSDPTTSIEPTSTSMIDPSSSSSSESESESTGDPPFHDAADCSELRSVTDVSGLYTLPRPGLPGDTVVVYCDMETDGGGWTLVARSTPGGAPGNFGWRSRSGHPADDSAPYSLSLQENAFKFGELLVGSYRAGKTWGADLYMIGVPTDLVAKQQNDAVPVGWVESLGACAPAGGPTALQSVGFTALPSLFFFNEPLAVTELGLRPDGFVTADSCPEGGGLAGAQGMIMVR